MEVSDVYAELEERLNYHKSEYLIRILRKLVTPEEGRLLLQLPAEPFELAQESGLDEEIVNRKIQEFIEKGLVVTTRKGNRLVRDVTQLHDATLSASEKWIDTEFLDLWKEFYETDWLKTMQEYGKALSAPAVRIVPAWKAIERSPEISANEVLPEENMRELIRGADSIALIPCTCRRSMRKCDAPLDNCLQFNRGAEYSISRGAGRRLSVEEAIAIADQAEEVGLVHTWPLLLSPNLHEICNCCIDCCAIFDAGLRFDTIGQILEKSRFRAEIDQNLCNGCQDCVERCFFGAIEMKQFPPAKKLKAALDPDDCFGCGLCVVSCNPEAITMKLVQA